MSPFGVIPRAIVAAVIIATMPVAAVAQQTLKIFDAHLHYKQICANFPSPCADTGILPMASKALGK